MEPAQLPPPLFCDACASVNIEFRAHKKRKGAFVWACNDCNASVGAHTGTRNPFGTMADGQTRLLRAEAHVAFDNLWKADPGVRGPYMDRNKAYVWLSHILEVPVDNCHISCLTPDQLLRVIEASKQRAEELEKAHKRRSKKKLERRLDDRKRELSKTWLRKDNRRKVYRNG